MGVVRVSVDLKAIGASSAVRLDARFHERQRRVAEFVIGLRSLPLGTFASHIGNGVNLPRAAYGGDGGEDLYFSVAAVSSFYLRSAAASNLVTASDKIVGTNVSARDAALVPSDLIVTRSGTPGIAWSPSASSDAGEGLRVPSGFLLRARVRDADTATFLTAVLNHPVWRLISNGLSAGKRQDNLSQQQLASIPIPAVPVAVQKEIASAYREAVGQIQSEAEDVSAFEGACDAVLTRTTALGAPESHNIRVQRQHVALTDVARSSATRLDNRWHGPRHRAVLDKLSLHDTHTLGSLLRGPVTKGQQPEWVDEEAAVDSPRAIATISLQVGRVVAELTKSTTSESVEAFPIVSGDLLVAMDGDGSLGKAAVYDGEHTATVDSHVGRGRLLEPDNDLALALACFLNSTWGREQTAGRMSGATGQTQLAPADLSGVIVPRTVIQNRKEIAAEYAGLLSVYETPAQRARTQMCIFASTLTEILVASGSLSEPSSSQFASPADLSANLEVLYRSTRKL